jgi:hypothetical protein
MEKTVLSSNTIILSEFVQSFPNILILKELSKRNNIAFNYTYYEQFDSVLIDSINNDINGVDGKYWQYYVNEDIPMVGADKYLVTNGDYIEWRFEVIEA